MFGGWPLLNVHLEVWGWVGLARWVNERASGDRLRVQGKTRSRRPENEMKSKHTGDLSLPEIPVSLTRGCEFVLSRDEKTVRSLKCGV